MGSKWVLVLVVLLTFVSLQGCLSQISGCWDEERVALLQLKHFFNRPNDPYYSFNPFYTYSFNLEGEHKSDWPVEGERNSDCCQWKRVECNNSTGRVIRLNLQEARDRRLREGYLNASLFSAFEQLEELDLSFNSIAGFVDNGGLDKLSRLRNLEYLNLDFNMFNNDIFSSLIALPSLKYLALYGNRLNETIDLQGLDSCKNLKELVLSRNQIEKVVFPKGLDKLSTLTKLEYLGLGGNMFNNDIFSSLIALPSLTSLYLYANRLNETVDLQGLDSCKNLKNLGLSFNQIEKVVFPKGLDKRSTLTNLELLDLEDNLFNNDIFSSLTAFPSLKHLYLYGNRLNETVDLQGLDSLRNLEGLSMGINMLNNDIFSSLIALPSLTTLLLSGNRLNEIVDLQDM